MRKILLAQCLLLFLALQVSAQVKANKRNIRQVTSAQVQLYQLHEEQAEKMAEIQEHRLTNLVAIEELRQTDYERYLLKSRSIRKYVEQATLRLLNSQQRLIFEQQQSRKEQAREKLLQQLKTQNAGQAERELALLRLEEDWQ